MDPRGEPASLLQQPTWGVWGGHKGGTAPASAASHEQLASAACCAAHRAAAGPASAFLSAGSKDGRLSCKLSLQNTDTGDAFLVLVWHWCVSAGVAEGAGRALTLSRKDQKALAIYHTKKIKKKTTSKNNELVKFQAQPHRAEALCKLVPFPQPLLRVEQLLGGVTKLWSCSSSEKTFSFGMDVFLRDDCLSYNRDSSALKYTHICMCRHPQAAQRRQNLLKECKWRSAGCHWKPCLSCLCWKSMVLWGSRTYSQREDKEHLSIFSHSCGFENRQALYTCLLLCWRWLQKQNAKSIKLPS